MGQDGGQKEEERETGRRRRAKGDGRRGIEENGDPPGCVRRIKGGREVFFSRTLHFNIMIPRYYVQAMPLWNCGCIGFEFLTGISTNHISTCQNSKYYVLLYLVYETVYQVINGLFQSCISKYYMPRRLLWNIVWEPIISSNNTYIHLSNVHSNSVVVDSEAYIYVH